MHPTPAVGGEPLERAAPLIPALEGLDRGWYSGPVGWTDATGDGEFCVALRCALLRGDVARCYAGNGIVRDSDPARELAETEVKLAGAAPAARRAEAGHGGDTASQTRRCSATFAARVAAHLDDARGARAASARSSAVAERPRGPSTRSCARP